MIVHEGPNCRSFTIRLWAGIDVSVSFTWAFRSILKLFVRNTFRLLRISFFTIWGDHVFINFSIKVVHSNIGTHTNVQLALLKILLSDQWKTFIVQNGYFGNAYLETAAIKDRFSDHFRVSFFEAGPPLKRFLSTKYKKCTKKSTNLCRSSVYRWDINAVTSSWPFGPNYGKHDCGDKLTFSRGPTVTHGQILVAMS